MMINFVMIAMGLSLVSGIPKPDLVSVDIGSIQAGGGYAFSSIYPGNSFVLPQVSLLVGQARLYWGKKWAFAAGAELFREHVEFIIQDASLSSVYKYGTLLMPQAGFSILLGSSRPRLIRKEACLDPLWYKLFYGENYVPRLDIVGGLSPIQYDGIQLGIMPTVRIEAKLLITRSLQLILANQSTWFPDSPGPLDITSLSLCFAIGCDYLIHDKQPNEGESN